MPPEPGQGPDSIMQAKSEQEPTVIPEQGTNDLTRGVEDITSDLTDIEEDMAAMQEDTDVKMSNAEGKGGEVVSTSPEVAALAGDLNQSNAVAEVGQVLERLGEHSESPAPPSAEPVESELSDLAEDSDVDGIENDVDQKQESAKANSKAPPSRKPRSSSARHAPPSKSAARDGEKSDAPRSKRRSSTREVAPPVNGLVEHPDDELIVAKKEIESKSNTKPVSSKTSSQSGTASPAKRRPGRKPAKKQTKRGAKESAPQKFRPSVTVSKKTLASIYENAPLSFVEKRLRLLLPHVRYQSFDEVQDYDLVWARPNRQSAYWPAEVCLDVEERDGDVPQVVLDADPNKDGANKREESSERSRSPSKAPRSGDASMSDGQKRIPKHYEHYLLVQWFPQEAKSSW